MQTTLKKIRAHSPCASGWTRLLAHLGKTKADNKPLPLSSILESNGLDDTLWCFQAVDGFDREKRLYFVWCVRQVQHLMTDPRSLAAPDVAEQFANGLASAGELAAANDAANDAATDAANAAWAAWAAANANANATANAAAWAAWAAANATANAAAAAANATANATDAANANATADAAAGALAGQAAAGAGAAAADATADATADAAWAASRAFQIQELKRVLACTEAGIDPYPPQKD